MVVVVVIVIVIVIVVVGREAGMLCWKGGGP